MNLIDEEFVQPKKIDKSKRTTKILLIAIIVVVILIVAIMILMMALKTEPLKVKLDGNSNSNIKQLLLFENGEVSIPIKEIAPYLGYESFNGDYINKSEETDKCYIESSQEVVNFVANSNKIEKINPQTMESFYYIIDEPVKLISGKLYITPQGLMKAFNVYFNYNENKNQVIIQTMSYILDGYKDKAVELGFSNISYNYEDAKASINDLVITIDSKGKYGIYNMATEQEILEAKYDKISYIPVLNEFLITSNGRMGIKDPEGNDKVKTKYQDIGLISQDLKLYMVKQDDRYGVIDATENVIIPIAFDQIGIDIKKFEKNNLKNSYVLLNDLIPVMRDNKWGLFDTNGQQICKLIYDDLGCVISSGKNANSVLTVSNYELIVARKGDSYYLLNKEGKEIGNSIGFQAIYMDIVAGKTTYYLLRNDTTVDLEKIIERLLNMNKNN